MPPMRSLDSLKVFFLLWLLAIPVTAECREAPARGLFVSVIQKPNVLSSHQAIEDLISFAKNAGVQNLFVQVYRANQAWFPSSVADSTPYQNCLASVGEDPLALLIVKAHASGIKVHAWMNLLSLSANEEAPLLKKYGPDILTRNLHEKKSLKDYKIDDQYFLEPGDLRLRKDLSTLVAEVLSAYPGLDGIQFDYIRYPDWQPAYGYTKMNVERFKKATGRDAIDEDSPVWKQWKRDQVTGLLRELAVKARTTRPGIIVSTTGLVRYSRAYHEAYQDWRYWVKSGLVNYVTLMCYSKNRREFEKDVADAKKALGSLKKTNIAVGAYAFLDSPEIFQQQFIFCEEANARSCVTFHYGNFLENPDLTDALANHG